MYWKGSKKGAYKKVIYYLIVGFFYFLCVFFLTKYKFLNYTNTDLRLFIGCCICFIFYGVIAYFMVFQKGSIFHNIWLGYLKLNGYRLFDNTKYAIYSKKILI